MKTLMTLILILTFAMIMSRLSVRFKLPTVVGELVAGVLLGPAGFNWISFNGFINKFAGLGVICLMFVAGLKSNLKLLKRYFTPSVVVASVGVIVPMIVIPVIGFLVGLSFDKALFLGVTFSATSVSISVEVLTELKRLKTKEGVTILGAAVVDDVIAVVLLGIVSTITHQNVSGSQIQSLGLVTTMVCQVVYFVLIWLLIAWIGPRLVTTLKSVIVTKQGKAMVSLIICFTLAYLADVVGLSAITGAFLSGLIINRTSWNQDAQLQVLPMGNLIFIPVFFISIGLNMSLSGIVKQWPLLVILVIAAVLTKLLGAGTGSLCCHYSLKSSLMVGSGMISRGEVALIIAQLGYVHSLLSAGLYSTVVSAIIITTILAPVIMKKLI